jgi:hypothetical protein
MSHLIHRQRQNGLFCAVFAIMPYEPRAAPNGGSFALVALAVSGRRAAAGG